MTEILMPALSPTMEEGSLAKWFVAVGDSVKAGDVLAEIETDKATMEVEAVDDGVVGALLVPAGTEGVKVNAAIARLDPVGSHASPASPVPSVAARRIAAEEDPGASSQNGGGQDGAQTKDEASAAAAQADAAPPSQAPAHAAALNASPLAARLARAAGLDLAAISGSGPAGRVLKADIDAARGVGATPAPVASAAERPRPPTPTVGAAAGTYDLIPLDGMRRTIARRMADSFRDVPHFPLSVDIELDELIAARARINDLLASSDAKVSLNDMFIKAAAQALRQVPEANASYTPEGLAMHHHADIAVAVAVEGGLVTPVVRAAETKGVGAIAAEMKALADRARERRLRPEEYQGGTFSISNLGMFGVGSCSSIINEPQGAILSIGAGERRPVVRGEALAIATVMSVTLTCDHRVMDGVVGARFLQRFAQLLQTPLLLLT